jgi:hypothetical protein
MKRLAWIAITLMAQVALATSVPKLTFAELSNNSEVVVTGRITKSWAAWDNSRSHIWTHYELRVSGTAKGKAAATLEFAEPGGSLDGMGMTVADSVQYTIGESVLVFLQRVPNGYLRTTGWGQGKFTVDSATHLHPATPLAHGESLEGLSLREALARIAALPTTGKAAK